VTTGDQPERVEGYEAFFGFNEAPFSLTPDPRFLFGSASHSAALAQVAYALERREPVVVITGEIGTGKTLLCRTVLQRLHRKTFLCVISDPQLDRDDLLKEMLQDFGVISKDRAKLTDASRHELIQTLQAFLRSLAPIQAHAVVIIDEAQHLQPEVLEQIRLLSNTDDERGTLLQIILVGQTDLEPLLSRPELRQLQQRVSRRFRLEPLTSDEVKAYITHRLTLAGERKPPYQLPGATELAQEIAEWASDEPGVEFTPDALESVSELSRGLPRVINLLCDHSLERACASRLRLIDRPLVLTAARALGVGESSTPEHREAPDTRPLAAPDESFWTATRRHSEAADQIVGGASETAPLFFSARTPTAAAPPLTKYLVPAASLIVLAAAAIFIGVRAARPPEAAPPAATAPPASTARVSNAPPDPAPGGANAAVPNAEATAGTPTPPPIAPAAGPDADKRREVTQLHDPRFEPPPPAAPPTGARFDIVVASFRTDSRATSVAAEVVALGLPVRRRVSDGWQQVLSGPFASRADAEQAQQRLARAGVTGTQIVPTAR
jgi:general secretion pathway protein A